MELISPDPNRSKHYYKKSKLLPFRLHHVGASESHHRSKKQKKNSHYKFTHSTSHMEALNTSKHTLSETNNLSFSKSRCLSKIYWKSTITSLQRIPTAIYIRKEYDFDTMTSEHSLIPNTPTRSTIEAPCAQNLHHSSRLSLKQGVRKIAESANRSSEHRRWRLYRQVT